MIWPKSVSCSPGSQTWYPVSEYHPGAPVVDVYVTHLGGPEHAEVSLDFTTTIEARFEANQRPVGTLTVLYGAVEQVVNDFEALL